MEKLKIGIVGAGNIACNAHLPAYQKCDNTQIVAIADLNLDRAKEAAEKFGIPEYYGSVEEMLAKADIQAVDVCTWNNGHAPVAIAALNAGKHVICEKPLTVSDELAEQIAAAVKKNGVKFMLAAPGRFGEKNCYLRKQIEEGKFGQVY
ncbi:MAG: Gfo/Idh/MocA family oxidoreductase, partial [Clostridiales bacterium]|nr:Gfo/Idh/MocA family oxidoreductase [Candidatus Coliplasma caballi]